MTSLFRTALVGIALLLAAGPAAALDYRSLAAPTVMYDAPSIKAKPLYVIARDTPVEVVVALDGWLKVRDASGSLAWIEKGVVADQRTVQVSVSRAQVRSQPQADAPLVFEAEKNVVLTLLEAAPAGWAKVQHRDGQTGYVRADQVWGL
ncbi:bacterial SH3 domain protein [mine drainage metagenome]|uniref:Bacterial SH3 domain protein n=1 Tax=mine drainage metagenome TaxID=410659 RepID=A0A1J5S095_9ZZZZ